MGRSLPACHMGFRYPVTACVDCEHRQQVVPACVCRSRPVSVSPHDFCGWPTGVRGIPSGLRSGSGLILESANLRDICGFPVSRVSVRRYLRHERMGVFRPSLWFHRSPTGHSPREPRISRAFTSAARATAQEVVALAGLASIHPQSCGRSGVLVRRSKERLLCPSMLGIACSEAHYTKR